MMRRVLIGNIAIAEAVKLAKVDVISAYPITPQTIIVEKLAEMVEKGELNARYIRVDSEHSAMAVVYGASAGGSRVFTATSSHGLLYMYEMMWWVANSRLPVVMALVTRALGPPWNIHTDHQDALTIRDSGWIIGFAENVQEAFDMTLQAYKIAEDERVLLPHIVALDGFILSHTAEPLDIPDEKDIGDWIPERRPYPYVIEPGERFAVGNLGPDEVTMELRWYIWRAMERSKKVIDEVGREYSKIVGRNVHGLIDKYRVEDAKYLVVSMGSWSGDAKDAVDILRDEGYDVGVARIKYFRPFPYEELGEILGGVKAVLVVDRGVSMGMGGILGTEIKSRYGEKVKIKNVVAGLGGVDVGSEDFNKMIRRFIDEYESGQTDRWDDTLWFMPWWGGGE